MKILIADDSNEKIGKLRAALLEAGISDDDVAVAFTSFDARKLLRQGYYDLFILDVLIPQRAGDTPRHSNSVELLLELAERDSLTKPRHIIGLTAYDDAIREAGPAFVSRTWAVIKYTTDSDEWKSQIIGCINYISSSLRQAGPKAYQTDVCLISALQMPEYAAVKRIAWNWLAPEPLDDNTFIQRGKFVSGGHQFTAAAAFAPRMGMVAASLLAAKLIDKLSPRFLVMAGICGGVKGKVNIGDVVVADPTWDWQSGKHFVKDDQHHFAIAPEPISLATFVRARVDQLRADREFFSRMRAEWPKPSDTELKLKPGPMASGASVLADSDVVEKVLDQNRNLIAVEMEAYGVAAAARSATHPRPTPIVCKSVCDFADELKNHDWQEYAAHCSARTIQEFFERYMSEISELAGTQ